MGFIFIPSHMIMAELYAFNFGCPCVCACIFLFLGNNLSRYQQILIKLGISNDIVEIWFGIANGQSYLSTT